MTLDWMNMGNWFPPSPEGGRRLTVPRRCVFLSPPLIWSWGCSVPRRAPGSLSCFPVLPAPAQSERGGSGAGPRVGICCGWEGVSVWNCKDEFFRPGRVGHWGCLHAAGRPLAQWSNTFLRACCCMQGCCLPCLAWLRAGRLAPGGEMLSPSCSLGSEGEEVESPGCFWEKSSLMWGACLLQVGFVSSLVSLLFFACFYFQDTLVWQSHLFSPDLCSGSVPSSWLWWKTTNFPSPFSFQQQGRVDRLAEQSSGSNESSEGGSCLASQGWPVLPSGVLAAPQRQGALRELCTQGDGVCEGGCRADLGGRCCAGVVVLVLL